MRARVLSRIRIRQRRRLERDAANPVGIANDMYRYLVFNNPNWDYKTLDIKKDVPLFDKTIGPLMNSSDTNLKPFFDHGGKLLMYHGWADPGIPAGNSVEYYTQCRQSEWAANPEHRTPFGCSCFPALGIVAAAMGPAHSTRLGALDQWRDKGRRRIRFMRRTALTESWTRRGRFARIRRSRNTREPGTPTLRRTLRVSEGRTLVSGSWKSDRD